MPGFGHIRPPPEPTVGEENIVNQVLSQYNDFGQLTAQYQAHGGAVNTSTTPNVQYAYADGSANTIRPMSLTYPNGRVLSYDYGTTDGTNDAASRIETLVDDDSTPLAEYEYLGLGSIVEVDYPQPDLRYRLFDPGLSGDIYTSLDRFGRVIDCHWYDYGSSASAAQIKYGYDRASNRIWREDPVAAANGKRFDELYAYDGLQRLKEMQRGTLNGGKDAVTNLQFEQCWSLDATGNWSGFRSDDDGNGWSLVQQRTANEVNEITGISETTGPSWATPAYDPAGNMTTIPQPSDPTGAYAATYDAWNRLTKLTDGEDIVQENQYDARRFRIVRKDYAEGTLAETRHFYYTAGWQSIEERLDSDTDPERQYVWGLRYIDDLVLRDRPDLEEWLYGLQDGNWNMIAVADENGDVQERYAYSAYGDTSIFDGSYDPLPISILKQNILFTGIIFDTCSLLYYFRFRYVNTSLGAFTSRDPVGYADGTSLSVAYFAMHGTVDPEGQYAGIGIGWGYTVIIPSATGPSIGFHGSYTTSIVAHRPAGGAFGGIRFCVCDTASFGFSIGVGAAATSGFFLSFTAGRGSPTSGASITLGAGVGIGFPAPALPLIPEITIDVDFSTRSTTITYGKWTMLGFAGYVAVRITGNCTGCSKYIWNIGERVSEIKSCFTKTAATFTKAMTHLVSKKAFPRTTVIFNEQN